MAKPLPIEQLKETAHLPDNKWGKLLGATPVIMTVVATLLAGLASSEMTKAQYERAYAAQIQSKAGDQWAFFQAKRLRGELQRNTLDLFAAQGAVTTGEDAPLPPRAPVPAPEIDAALKAAGADAPSEILNPLLNKIPLATLQAAQAAAREHTAAYDALTTPLLRQIVEGGSVPARLRFNASRYDHEAQLNAKVARLYELQVRKGNLVAERHHARSQKFFFGMLAAQMGVVIGTLAIAAKQRSLLWAIAAGAGVLAIVFAIYVYLYV